ncbi:putative RNA methyltransferase [Dongia sp.]|uniref:putative RNA methyltransferase n=1 Tax=Dongia sp. TaxID=1977262 RepID=UPI003752BF40
MLSKFDLLRCPVCRADLTLVERTLRCPQRHSFDLARAGYVNLLTGHGAAPAEGGDDARQLQRRDAFLAKGHFDRVTDAIRAVLPPGGGAILDAGCGTAYHLQRLATGDHPCAGIDVSKEACAFAAKRYPKSGFAVADIWRDWPVRDACADLVLSIFAPRNFVEAARVLRPGGILAVAYPGPDHLIELRREFDLIDQGEAKTETYAAGIAAATAAPRHQRLRAAARLDAPGIANVILMGPNARHARLEALPPEATRDVSFDIELLIARKPA